ncbi:phosphatidate phosphatase LPIN3 isoform X2 [Lacerta agilis]|uniref:phosphatidate phosphatase LPIN3 isoform X2 n=1 Tax=Lacerta agilis TaxID=80427 RepID=UPI0014193578|nr:phosphatidate phosphatase LPIN3 isoform X2 [Lacerta agilis]
MNYVGQLAETVLGTVKELYKGLNPATLTGCIDVIVVRQPDGSLLCSPFHVRFGKLRVLHSSEKVVDIEINGEPVNLHMKLGDNGEAFFVQESEEHKESIPTSMCTSPIPLEKNAEPVSRSSSLHGNPEVLGSETALRKKRWRKKKPKKRESLGDSTSEEEEGGTESEKSLEEKRKLLTSNNTMYYSFTEAQNEGAGALQPKEAYPYSDGELAPLQSLPPNCPSAPKSDSELEMRNPEMPLCSESHMQWSWGRLPEVSKSDRVEAAKSAASVSMTAAITPAATIPVGEMTHFAAITPDSESDLGMEDSDEALCSPAAPVVRPTPVFPSGNGLPVSEETRSSIQPTGSALQTTPSLSSDMQVLATAAENEGIASVEEIIEPVVDVEVPSSRKASLTNPEPCSSPELKQEKRRGSMRRSSHLGPTDIYLEDLSNLDAEQIALYFPKRYYNWAVAAPMLLSLQAFQKDLPKSTVDRLMKEKMPKKGGRWWFSWRRRELSHEEHESTAQKSSRANSSLRRRDDGSSSDDDSISSGRGERPVPDALTQKFLPTYKKSLRLSSDQIKSLNLRDGVNEVAFSVTTQYQGTCRCEANIYLWNWDDKVVISDIDGTITRSDALGHILPHLGKDWTHQGIAKLFHKIHLNGYKFLYCSARSIGMAHITKGYLTCVNDQGCVLPKGPILLAPSSLISAFHREVIEKKPEVFKIACLTDIRNLFGRNKQPFHAAFGNRPNDVHAYKEVALPETRIFTVNPKGELTQEHIKIHKSTYDRLSEVVELLFPPIGKDVSVSLASPEFSQFSYWRSPLATVDFEDFAL